MSARPLVGLVLVSLILTVSPKADDRSFFRGVPLRTTYPNAVTLLDSGAFVVGYDETRRDPAWAAYRLFPNPGTFAFDRLRRFRIDDRTVARVSHDDYTNSGFSRGHMAPNFAIMTRYGEDAQRASFVMSNVVPQLQALNGGPWENLESLIARDYANNLGGIWVVTGPIYDSTVELLSTSPVEIPDRFFKIVIDELNGQPRALAFIMEEHTASPAVLSSFLVSIDTIETETGFDFFHGLADTVEDPLELNAATALWMTSGAPPLTDPTPTPTTPINVNTALSEVLESLPGIGPTLAQRIIDGRPYAAVDDLVRVNGIGQATLAILRPLVTVN